MAEYDLLLGKRTYDIFSGYWPYNQDNPIGAKFQRINKYVLTHSDEPLAWENSHKICGRRRRRMPSPSSSKATAATCSSRAAARSIRRCLRPG